MRFHRFGKYEFRDTERKRAAQEIRQEDEPLVYAEPRIKR